MSTGQSRSGQTDAPRILNPRAALLRLRPVKLKAVNTVIWPNPYRVDLLLLFRQLYPQVMYDNLPVDDWTDLLRYFLLVVEEDRGIKMDWPALDDLYQWAQEEEEDEDWEPSGLAYLGLCRRIIPVDCFGFYSEGFSGRDIHDYPALHLLNGLLEYRGWALPDGPEWKFLRDLRGWEEADKAAAREHLERLDTGNLPEPLNWLPEMARYAIGETDNELLDQPAGFEKWDEGWFKWGELDRVCELWAETQVFIQRSDFFNEWACADVQRLKQITELVIGRQLWT